MANGPRGGRTADVGSTFAAPMASNGRIYVPTGASQVDVIRTDGGAHVQRRATTSPRPGIISEESAGETGAVRENKN